MSRVEPSRSETAGDETFDRSLRGRASTAAIVSGAFRPSCFGTSSPRIRER